MKIERRLVFVCKKHKVVKVYSEWKPINFLLEVIEFKRIPLSEIDFREIECSECEAENLARASPTVSE